MKKRYFSGFGWISSGNQLLAAREHQAAKDHIIRARRERTRQARGRMAQTKGWLTALKMHAAIVWVANGRAGIEASNTAGPKTPT